MNDLERVIRPKGKPRKFPTQEDFQNAVVEYLNLCEIDYKQYPNIAGFCVHCDMHRGTFYDQEKHYPDTYKKVMEMFENASLNSKHASDTIKIFYLKNKFGYRDRQEQQITATLASPVQVDINLSNLSDDELQIMKTLTKKAQTSK